MTAAAGPGDPGRSEPETLANGIPEAAPPAPGSAPDESGSRVRRTAAAYALSAVVGRGSGLAVVPLLFTLPLDAVGAWSVVMAVRSLAAAVGSFSLDTFVTQAYYAAPGDARESLARACVSRCARWNGVAALLLAPFLVIPAARMTVVMAWSGQAVAIVNTALAAARIREDAAKYLALSVPPGLAAIVLCMSLVLIAHLGVWGLVIGLSAPWVACALIVAALSLRRRVPVPTGHVSYLRCVHPGRMLGDCFGQVDRLLLGGILSPSQLGLYELATRLASPAALVWSSAKAALMADALRRLSEDERARIERHFVASWWAGTAVAAGTLTIADGFVMAGAHAAWTPALPLVAGALAVQSWLFTQAYYGSLIYHRRIVAAQAWLPIVAIATTIAGGGLGAAFGAASGALFGFIAAQALNTLISERIVARCWPAHPPAPRLVAASVVLTGTCASATFTPIAVSVTVAGLATILATANAVVAWRSPPSAARTGDG